MSAAPPLAGIRVLDFCWVLAGPLGTRILAHFGAEVIHVTSARGGLVEILPPGSKDLRLGAFHNLVHTGKRSISVDPRTERGRELLLELAARCDLVTNNFRPGALERMGLGYDVLRTARPDLVLLNLPGCGRDGPWRDLGSYGNMLVAAAGINHLTGFAHRSPRGMGVAYPDFTAPYLLVTAVLAALAERDRSGCGRELDLSQLSATVSLIGVEWMQYRSTGRTPPPRANRDPDYCPHGVFPAAGEDEWLALAVEGETEWRAFCELLGRPELARDPRFATHALRKAHEDALDEIVSTWTRTCDRWQAADALQARGIAAAAVANLRDTLERDPQLRSHYQWLRQPCAPDVPIPVAGEAIRFAGEERPLERAPEPGEHDAYVLCELLGLPREELDALRRERVIRPR